MTQDLMTLDGYEEYADQGQQSYSKQKEIRMCVDLMKEARAAGIPVGNFFIFDPNVPQGESPLMTDIGTEFEGVILRDAQRVEVYNQQTKQYEVVSSEFRSNVDPIILYDRTLTDGEEEIVACLPYTNKQNPEMSIYHLKQTRYRNLRTKYTAYILVNGEIYKFGFAATDNTGCEPKEFKPRGFEDAAEDSFLHIKQRAHSQAGVNVLFSHTVRIFSKHPFEKSVDFIKGFELTGRVTADRKEEIDEALNTLSQSLQIRFQKKTIRAWNNTVNKDQIVCFDERHIPYLVAHPRVFTQQEKMTPLKEGVVIPEIPALNAPKSQAPRADVVDVDAVARDLGGDPIEENIERTGGSEEVHVAPKKAFNPDVVPPDMSKKPRNRKEAIQQKREEKEYIEESGLGAAAGAIAAEARIRKEQEAADANNPELQKFLRDTDPNQEPTSKSDLPEGY